jgi:hypothetical protein
LQAGRPDAGSKQLNRPSARLGIVDRKALGIDLDVMIRVWIRGGAVVDLARGRDEAELNIALVPRDLHGEQ